VVRKGALKIYINLNASFDCAQDRYFDCEPVADSSGIMMLKNATGSPLRELPES
jgi:hypothetical protein